MFYAQFIKLCNERNTYPSIVAEAIGLNRSSATAWKRGVQPSSLTIQKLADYFGVDASYFSEKEKPATERDGLEVLLDDERTLLHSYRTMTEEDKQMMLAWVRRLKGDESD